MINKKGSALLIITITMALALCIIVSIWRGALFLQELGFARQNYEIAFWQKNALLLWSIALCKENFDHLLQYAQNKPLEIGIDQWPPKKYKSANSYKPKIVLSKHGPSTLDIQIAFEKKHEISCSLERIDEDSAMFQIKNYQIY